MLLVLLLLLLRQVCDLLLRLLLLRLLLLLQLRHQVLLLLLLHLVPESRGLYGRLIGQGLIVLGRLLVLLLVLQHHELWRKLCPVHMLLRILRRPPRINRRMLRGLCLLRPRRDLMH